MRTLQQKAIDFVYVVKQKFSNEPSKFNEFAHVLSTLQQDHTLAISKLKTLFTNDPDLLYGLHQFLPNHSNVGHDDMIRSTSTTVADLDSGYNLEFCYQPNSSVNKDHSWLLGESSSSELFDRIRDRCIEKNDVAFRVLINFTEAVLAYHEKRISYYQVDQILKVLFKDDPDLLIESNRVVSQSVDKPVENKSGLLSKGEKETDYGSCSLYEATMNVKEFYLFEMDLAFSRLESTIQKLEKNVDTESFTVLDFKCIKKLYNDSDDDRDGGFGEPMVEILKADPVGRIVVLQRLRQKKMQLEEQKLRLDRIWTEIFEDITNKGRVCRHREFLRRTKKASINGFKE